MADVLCEQPALLGGEPVTRKEFPAYNTIGPDEKREVMQVLDSGVLSAFLGSPEPGFNGGPKVQQLEAAWSAYFRIKHAVAMNSATSALHAAVAACRIGSGEEVITSPVTMTATATAVLANGAVPVFADIDPRTLNLDPACIAQHITRRTKAILVIHVQDELRRRQEARGADQPDRLSALAERESGTPARIGLRARRPVGRGPSRP